jgi:misacylated tRNA(Ala) deacylase
MYVKPPTKNNKIRLVKIGNIDLQPCGGTHVKNTSEIKKIIIGKIENKGKKNKRINISLNS